MRVTFGAVRNIASYRFRLVTLLAGVSVLAGAVALDAARAATPPLMLSVGSSGALEVVLGNGTRIRTASGPGAVIPPGAYLVIVTSDLPPDRDLFHMYHLFGPGVKVQTELLPCENPMEVQTVTLRPSSTYTYEDSRHPQIARVVFSTSAQGSSGETSGTPVNRSTPGLAGSVSNQSKIGSGVKSVRGTLIGTVSAVGALTLTQKGQRVTLIKSGRYKVAVDDTTPKRGFTIERLEAKPLAVTGPSFVGKRAVTVDLKPGQWTFYSSAGKKHAFTVVR
jgi:hypothetical protein